MFNYKIAAAAVKLIIFLLPATLITLSGCATVSKEITQDSSAPSVPSYRLGATFVYSDGSWATVSDITPDRVTWQNHRGNVYSGSPDFTYRPADLRTRSRHVSRRFVPRSDFLVNRDTSLWPLKKGKTASFTEIVTSRKNGVPEKSYRRIPS